MRLSLDIPCPENILWWIICIAFIGTLITGIMMRQAARFSLTLDGVPVALQKFHRLGKADGVATILQSMSMHSRASMRAGLRMDFLFMPFFYGLIVCLSVLIRWDAGENSNWYEILYALCWLPFAMWLFDLIENLAALSILSAFERKREVSTTSALLMAAGNVLKSVTLILWLLVMASYGVAEVVDYGA